MAYTENTGLSTPQDLIDAICTFVASNGWTVERNDLVGSTRTATVRIVGTSDYIHFTNPSADEISYRISVGYNGAETPANQPNVQPFSARTNGLTGPYPRVYFFAEGTEVNIVVESSLPNQFRHIAFGVLEKYGTYDGGTYADGTYRSVNNLGDYGSSHHVPFGAQSSRTSDTAPYAGCVRADDVEGGRTNFFHWFGDGSANATYGRAECGVSSWARVSLSAGWLGRITGGADVNAFSGRSVSQPIVVHVQRTGSPMYISPIGRVKNMEFINIVKFTNAQEVDVGGDTWKIFPALKRSLLSDTSGAAPDYGTHTMGYAIKKVA